MPKNRILARRRRIVTRDEFGDKWAFTVDSGEIRRYKGGRIVFISGGVTYAMNGLARGAMEAKQGAAAKWHDIFEVWLDHPGGILPKVDISPFIEVGLGLKES